VGEKNIAKFQIESVINVIRFNIVFFLVKKESSSTVVTIQKFFQTLGFENHINKETIRRLTA
jgi:hypothetical protein